MGLLLMVTICLAATCHVSTTATDYASDPSIQLFQEYVRINTTSGNDLSDAVTFWQNLVGEVEDVTINVYEYTSGYPVIVIKWPGTNSSLPSIMLNSHMDVVPADEDDGWSYPPFAADIDANGTIYGRGTQDMKSVGIQYFLALRNLKANGETLLRDVYMTLMPDEEVGGEHGMIQLLASDEFTAMNVGVELDEGTSFPLAMIALFYQDKVVWQIQVDCVGESGHSSTFPAANNTAAGQCRNFMNLMYEFREEQYEIAQKATVNDASKYTSVNMNVLSSGGTAINVLASLVTLYFDIRLSTTVNETAFGAKLNAMAAEAGPNVTITYILKNEQSPATIIDSSNPYYSAIARAGSTLGVTILPAIPPGSTDARFVRSHGVPAFGMSPMPNTPLLLHSVNECLNADIFLKGIRIYEEIIRNLANIAADQTSSDPSVYIEKTTE